MPWIFDKHSVERVLSIINNTYPEELIHLCDYQSLRKKITPEFFERFDDTLYYNDFIVRLAGNSDGISDTCQFILDSESGNIIFKADEPEPRTSIYTSYALSSSNISNIIQQPPEENIWIKHSNNIISELMKCRLNMVLDGNLTHDEDEEVLIKLEETLMNDIDLERMQYEAELFEKQEERSLESYINQ